MTQGAPDEFGLVIEPAPAAWHDLLHSFVAPLDPDRRRFRHELSLPLDRPIVMTGHQTTVWHPGILAKYFAAEAARSLGAAAVWLFVDQDNKDPFEIRFPARDRATGRLTARALRFAGPRASNNAPAAARPAMVPERLSPSDALPPSVAHGIASLTELLTQHATKPSAAEQIRAVLTGLLAPTAPDAAFNATSIARTHAFAELLSRMRQDPEACVHAYNAAVRRHPEAKLRPMTADDVNVRYELPLWHLEPGQPRKGVYAEDLDTIPVEQLAPKALFMTGLVRAFGCDLFIHGLGGGLYDRVTEEWFARWMPGTALAPTTVVSATLLLPLGEGPPPTDADVARARWTSHHARHTPNLLGDPIAQNQKAEFVRRLAQAKAEGLETRGLYRSLHETLDRARTAHAPELARLVHEADRLVARRDDRDLADDRTWPFPLFDPETIQRLRREIHARFSSFARHEPTPGPPQRGG